MLVRALIELLPDEQGNARARRPLYRPNHNFGGSENRVFFVGQVEIPEGEELVSGEPRELFVHFLDAAGLNELIKPGREWRLQEGLDLVGRATVVDVPNERTPDGTH